MPQDPAPARLFCLRAILSVFQNLFIMYRSYLLKNICCMCKSIRKCVIHILVSLNSKTVPHTSFQDFYISWLFSWKSIVLLLFLFFWPYLSACLYLSPSSDCCHQFLLSPKVRTSIYIVLGLPLLSSVPLLHLPLLLVSCLILKLCFSSSLPLFLFSKFADYSGHAASFVKVFFSCLLLHPPWRCVCLCVCFLFLMWPCDPLRLQLQSPCEHKHEFYHVSSIIKKCLVGK